MNDLICELVKETDSFLKEVPEKFNFENPQVDPEKLQEQLVENMLHHEGYGLSANQIGIPVQAFSMMLDDKPMVVFNPEILEWSEETTYIREGCLSFPGLYVAVERARAVAMKFQAYDGEEQGGSLQDMSAKIFQHEMEHMEGKLFIDNVSGFKLKSAMKKRRIYLKRINRNRKD
ncbi:MAG: peptide deformylase [Candidatus Pacebacteria bacterium]|jgi:peptide deformylase|nr:peptide deformylase [Candidatus Paceibacterota bacterium]